MGEQRIQTVKVVWETGDAKAKVEDFVRTVKGTDKAVEDLNRVLGANATVTQKTVLTTKEATAQARQQFTMAKRQVAAHTRLTEQLKVQIRQTRLNDNQQERYNAMMKLGENATMGQRLEIARLVKQLQAQRVAMGHTQRSMRGLRGQMQNLSWQSQDIAVQMQMGTDAMVIFSQQGSQLASGFGPKGALVGALIAVGGAVAGVAIKMITGKKSAKELAEAQEILNGVFQEGALDANDLSEEYKKLFVRSKDLALLTARTASFAAKDQMKAARDSIKELGDETFRVYGIIDEANASYAMSLQAIRRHNKATLQAQKDTAKELGLTVEKYKEITQLFKDGKNRTAANMLVEIATAGGLANREMTKLAMSFAKADLTVEESAKRIEQLRKIMTGQVTPDAPKETGAKKKKAKKEKDIMWDGDFDGLGAEIDRREKALATIQKATTKFYARTEDPRITEEKRYIATLATLNAEKEKLWEDDLINKTRIDKMMTDEDARHKAGMKAAEWQVVQGNLAFSKLASETMTETVDIISGGADAVAEQTADMNAFQKTMFLGQQSLAAVTAQINGISLGMKLAETFMNPSLIGVGTALGAASAGAIMGSTFAGMFDKGGKIPSGQSGIVAEAGNELVNGVMVKGPANVTSRKETAAMMNKAPQMNVSVVNEAGVNSRVEQIDANTVKIIAYQVFNQNIDKGVSGVLNNRNSKGTKALKRNTNTRSKF